MADDEGIGETVEVDVGGGLTEEEEAGVKVGLLEGASVGVWAGVGVEVTEIYESAVKT